VKALGIDPSTTATGLVVLQSHVDGPKVLFEDTVVCLEPKKLERCSAIAEHMMEVLRQFTPERVVIEGYGLNFRHPSSVIPLVEIGTVLRYFLLQLGYPYLEPTPGELKKAVLGKGTGKKQQMMLQIYKRWRYEAKDDNRADAFALAAIGLAHCGQLASSTAGMNLVAGGLKLN
jgi:Holliday junction resolvasome RuvABC endonuclease subunit